MVEGTTVQLNYKEFKLRGEVGGIYLKTRKSCSPFLITIAFFLTSVQVIIVPHIFCVLSIGMLNVSIDTFS